MSGGPYRLLSFMAALALGSTALFGQTVINIPSAATPAVVDANTILNLNPGGTLTRSVTVRNGGQVFLYGGRAQSFTLETGGEATVYGGGIHGAFFPRDGGSVYHRGGKSARIYVENQGAGELSGGAVEKVETSPSGTLLIEGSDFRIDAVPVSGLNGVGDRLQIDVPIGSYLTGVLADGTPFATTQRPGITYIQPGMLTLKKSSPPPTPTPGTTTINTPSTLAFVNGDQEVRVIQGGELEEQFRAGRGSRVVVEGGRVNAALHTVGATVDIKQGGYVGRRLAAFDDTVVQVNGGTLDGDSRFYRGSKLELNSGTVGSGTWIREGASMSMTGGIANDVVGYNDSDIHLSDGELRQVSTSGGRILVTGGSIRDQLDAIKDGSVTLAGGSHTDNIRLTEANLVLRGGRFLYNGQPIGSSMAQLFALAGPPTVQLGAGDVLSGVYEDGTPFVLSGDQESVGGNITLEETTLPERGPDRVEVPTATAPRGIRSGQTLVLRTGGTLPLNFTAEQGSTLEVEGGTVGNNLELAGAALNATGGNLSVIDAFMDARLSLKGSSQFVGINSYGGSQIEIDGASYTGGNFFRMWENSSLRIRSGQIQGDIEADESTVEITGGELKGLQLFHYSDAEITGGTFTGEVRAFSGSRVVATGGEIANVSTSIGDSDLVGVTTTTATIDGAHVGRLLSSPHSSIEMKSGIAARTDTSNQGGNLILRGGALGDRHQWLAGRVDLYGYDFEVNGVPVAGLSNVGSVLNFAYQAGSTITGILSDGTPFNLRQGDSNNGVNIVSNVLRLHRTAPVEAPAVINVPSSPAPYGATAGQTVLVNTGGKLFDHFVAAAGSVLRIQGGEVGENLEADRSQVTVSGGTVGDYADAFSGSLFTISGGTVGQYFEAHSGSVVRLLSGQLGRLSKALPGSTFEMKGGTLRNSFVADAATMLVTGGTIENELEAKNGTQLTIEGGVIGANFEANTGSHVQVKGGQIGSSFELRGSASAEITGGTFQSIDLRGSEVHANIHGGSLAEVYVVDGASVRIDGGQLGGVRIYQSLATMTGGIIGNDLLVEAGGQMRVEGGAIGISADVNSGSTLTLVGGTIGSQLHANAGATVALEGYGFQLNGTPISGLHFDDDTLVVNQRGGAIVTGFFPDGTPFTFKLNSTLINPRSTPSLSDLAALSLAAPTRDNRYDFFAPTAILRLTVNIPEPGAIVLLVGMLAFVAATRRVRINRTC